MAAKAASGVMAAISAGVAYQQLTSAAKASKLWRRRGNSGIKHQHHGVMAACACACISRAHCLALHQRVNARSWSRGAAHARHIARARVSREMALMFINVNAAARNDESYQRIDRCDVFNIDIDIIILSRARHARGTLAPRSCAAALCRACARHRVACATHPARASRRAAAAALRTVAPHGWRTLWRATNALAAAWHRKWHVGAESGVVA